MFVEIIIIIGFLVSVFQTLKILQIQNLIANNVYNNIRERLSDELYIIIPQIPEGDLGKAFVSYLRDQLNDIYNKYLEAKKTGAKTLSNEAFFIDLAGSTRADLRKYSVQFTDSFVIRAEEINEKNIRKFRELMLIDLSTCKYRIALKRSTISIYKKNINDLYKAFIKYQYLPTK